MKKILAIGLGCLLVGLSAPLQAADASTSGKNDYTKSVDRPYAQVLEAVKEAAKKEGFRVSNVHDIAASLKKDGIQREPYATVEVCNSKIAAAGAGGRPAARLGHALPHRGIPEGKWHHGFHAAALEDDENVPRQCRNRQGCSASGGLDEEDHR